MKPLALGALAILSLAACDRPARVSLEPPSAQFTARGQSVRIHASVLASNGRPLPTKVCAWSSSDEKVATVKGPHNEATVTAVAPGRAAVRCSVGSLTAEAPVVVRAVARLEVSPQRAEIRMLDRPEPFPLEVKAYDGEGLLLSGRAVRTRCENENVCRGDDRGQLWAVGPGESRVAVEVDEVRAEVSARTTDARTAEGKPKAVKGNPMLDYEKAWEAKQRQQK